MSATILDGRATRNSIFAKLRERVGKLAEWGVVPGMAPCWSATCTRRRCGVGPMTAAMPLTNVVEVGERSVSQ